jgi:hypothetical protein
MEHQEGEMNLNNFEMSNVEARALLRLIVQERFRSDSLTVAEARKRAEAVHCSSIEDMERMFDGLCKKLHVVAPEGV